MSQEFIEPMLTSYSHSFKVNCFIWLIGWFVFLSFSQQVKNVTMGITTFFFGS